MQKMLIISFVFLCQAATGQTGSIENYISQNAKEISNAVPGFKGLEFLDTLLENKRIVLLGESSHGTEEYAQTKLALIQYLHEKLGFNVLLFESPMGAGGYINLAKDTTSAETLVRNALQSIWHTKTISSLFDYIKTNNIFFGGFDPQFISSPYPSLLYTSALGNDPAMSRELLQLENRIAETIQYPRKHLSLKDSFSMSYASIAKRLDKPGLSGAEQLLRQIAITNSSYYAGITKGDRRDSCMAENLIWFAEKAYPGQKIIVWAHNMHIDKNATVAKRLMGKLLAGYFNDQLYVIGLYMINGHTALNSRKIIQVRKPPKGSLESFFVSKKHETAFIETNAAIFDRFIPTLYWGKNRQLLNLSKSYDAVIVINGVNPPVYLE